MNATVNGPYDSLAAMKTAYRELSDEIGKDILSPVSRERVKAFIRQGAATGRVLDAPKDRSTAQGLINFWVARLSAASRTADGTESGSSDDALSFEETLLADFDAATVKRVAADAEQWFANLPPDRQANARRALMRMVVLPADGKAFISAPVTRAALYMFGPPERIEAGLVLLGEKMILRVTPGDTPDADLVALHYEALMREWPRMAGWLDQRLRFRQASRYWEANNRASSALIRDNLLDEAQQYHDTDNLEQQFLVASAKREREQDRHERHLYRWIAGLAGVAALSAIAVVVLLGIGYQAEKAKGEAERAKGDAEKMQKQGMEAQALAESGSTLVLIDLLAKKNSAHYAKKQLIIQTLGQMVSATSDKAWAAAKKNWTVLEKDLKEDSALDYWFKREFFPGKAEDCESESNEDRIAKLTASRENSNRNARKELLCVSKYLRTYLQPGSKVKRRWYGQAEHSAAALAQAAHDGQTIEDTAPFNLLFWRLYLGEMVLVEGKDVGRKMVAFGIVLSRWEESGDKAPADLQAELIAASDELKKACEKELTNDPIEN